MATLLLYTQSWLCCFIGSSLAETVEFCRGRCRSMITSWMLEGFLIPSNLKKKTSNNKTPPKTKQKNPTKTWLQLLKSFYRRHSPKLVSLLPPCLFFPFSLHSFLWLEFYFLWLYILCKCNLSIYNCEVELFMCCIS